MQRKNLVFILLIMGFLFFTYKAIRLSMGLQADNPNGNSAVECTDETPEGC